MECIPLFLFLPTLVFFRRTPAYLTMGNYTQCRVILHRSLEYNRRGNWKCHCPPHSGLFSTRKMPNYGWDCRRWNGHIRRQRSFSGRREKCEEPSRWSTHSCSLSTIRFVHASATESQSPFLL